MKDKRAVITGAGSGIGRAAAELFHRNGARVAIVQRTKEGGREALEAIGGTAAGHLLLQADVSSDGEMKAAFDAVRAAWGGVDWVVANAGINGVWAPLPEITVEEWDKTMEVNLRGTFLTLKYAVPLMSGGGSIVIVSSINGNRVFSNCGASAYASSKAAQVALGKMAALELAPQGIRVNTVCPGSVTTNIEESTHMRNLDRIRAPVLFPQGEVPLTGGKPAEAARVAETILFLCSGGAHISGTEIYVDGAQSLVKG